MTAVSVCVSTYGAKEWEDRGIATADAAYRYLKRPNGMGVKAFEVSHVHLNEGTLAQARNLAAEEARCTWLVFLDADDSLNANYVEGVLAGHGDLRQPKTTFCDPNDVSRKTAPEFLPAWPSLFDNNWMVIGTAVRRSMFLDVGGFRELPAWEDWDLWLNCWQNANAVIGKAPRAIYHVGPVLLSGRNMKTVGNQELHDEIARRYR